MNSQDILFLVIVLAGAGCCLLWPVAKAVGERIRSRPDPALRDDLQAVREDVARELEQVRREVAELTERVDFQERVISKQREADRLPRGL